MKATTEEESKTAGGAKMATTKEYHDFVTDLISPRANIRTRKMMGEYLLYYNDKHIGGFYDNRFLLKPVKELKEICPDGRYEIPYEGAKEMFLVESEDAGEIINLMNVVYDALYGDKK